MKGPHVQGLAACVTTLPELACGWVVGVGVGCISPLSMLCIHSQICLCVGVCFADGRPGTHVPPVPAPEQRQRAAACGGTVQAACGGRGQQAGQGGKGGGCLCKRGWDDRQQYMANDLGADRCVARELCMGMGRWVDWWWVVQKLPSHSRIGRDG